MDYVENCRQKLGDKSKNMIGSEVRPAAKIKNPKPLTIFDKNHPYIYAEYDKGERG